MVNLFHLETVREVATKPDAFSPDTVLDTMMLLRRELTKARMGEDVSEVYRAQEFRVRRALVDLCTPVRYSLTEADRLKDLSARLEREIDRLITSAKKRDVLRSMSNAERPMVQAAI